MGQLALHEINVINIKRRIRFEGGFGDKLAQLYSLLRWSIVAEACQCNMGGEGAGLRFEAEWNKHGIDTTLK